MDIKKSPCRFLLTVKKDSFAKVLKKQNFMAPFMDEVQLPQG